jgi:hypothetical protein
LLVDIAIELAARTATPKLIHFCTGFALAYPAAIQALLWSQ